MKKFNYFKNFGQTDYVQWTVYVIIFTLGVGTGTWYGNRTKSITAPMGLFSQPIESIVDGMVTWTITNNKTGSQFSTTIDNVNNVMDDRILNLGLDPERLYLSYLSAIDGDGNAELTGFLVGEGLQISLCGCESK